MRILTKLVFQDTIEKPKEDVRDYPEIVYFSKAGVGYKSEIDYFIDSAEVIKELPIEYREKIVNKEPFEIEVVTRKVVKFELDNRIRVEWEGSSPSVGDTLASGSVEGKLFSIDAHLLMTPLENIGKIEIEPGTIFHLVSGNAELDRPNKFIIKTIEY